jgi:hypothetical protein
MARAIRAAVSATAHRLFEVTQAILKVGAELVDHGAFPAVAMTIVKPAPSEMDVGFGAGHKFLKFCDFAVERGTERCGKDRGEDW